VKGAPRYIYKNPAFSLLDLELVLKEYENHYNNPELFL